MGTWLEAGTASPAPGIVGTVLDLCPECMSSRPGPSSFPSAGRPSTPQSFQRALRVQQDVSSVLSSHSFFLSSLRSLLGSRRNIHKMVFSAGPRVQCAAGAIPPPRSRSRHLGRKFSAVLLPPCSSSTLSSSGRRSVAAGAGERRSGLCPRLRGRQELRPPAAPTRRSLLLKLRVVG